MSGDRCLSLLKYLVTHLQASEFHKQRWRFSFFSAFKQKICWWRAYVWRLLPIPVQKSQIQLQSLAGHQNGIWVLLCSFLSLLCLIEIKMPLQKVHESLGNTKTLYLNYTFANYICTYHKSTPGLGYGYVASSVQLQNKVLASICFSPKAISCLSMFCSFFCSKMTA